MSEEVEETMKNLHLEAKELKKKIQFLEREVSILGMKVRINELEKMKAKAIAILENPNQESEEDSPYFVDEQFGSVRF